MIPANCILLGRITKVHGFEGAVTVKTDLNLSENIPHGEPVFLVTEGRPVPFFIDYSDITRPGTVNLKFDDYNSAEKVREFVGCEVYIKKGSSGTENRDDLNELQGYRVKSGNNQFIGTITGIIANPGQILLDVKTDSGKSLLLPLHEDLIGEINKKQKTISMIIPDGLLELN